MLSTWHFLTMSSEGSTRSAQAAGTAHNGVSIARKLSNSPRASEGLAEPTVHGIASESNSRGGGEYNSHPVPSDSPLQVEDERAEAALSNDEAVILEALGRSLFPLSPRTEALLGSFFNSSPSTSSEEAIAPREPAAKSEKPGKRKQSPCDDDDDEGEEDSRIPMPMAADEAKLKMLKKLTPKQFEERLAFYPVILKRFKIARDINKPKNWHADRSLIPLHEHNAYAAWCAAHPEEALAFKFFEVKVNGAKHRKTVQANNAAFKDLLEMAKAFQPTYELYLETGHRQEVVMKFVDDVMAKLAPRSPDNH